MGMFRVLQLIITGDSKSATRAIGDVGTASEKTARQVKKDTEKTSGGFDDVHKSASKVHDKVGMIAGAVGISGLAFGIKDAVTAGAAFQAQQSSLHVALKNTGVHGANATKQVNKLSDAAERNSVSGGFAAPAELAALTQFETLTRSSSKSMQLNADAMNLARGTGLGYSQTERMIGQVLTGNVGRLQRYLGIIQPVKTAVNALSQSHKVSVFQLELQSKALGKAGPLWLKQQELIHGLNPTMVAQAQLADKNATATMALARIQQRYGGQTAAYAHTAAGGMSDLHNSLEVMAASVGSALLPALTAAIGALSSVASLMAKHKTVTLVLLSAVGALTVAWGLNALAMTTVWGEMTLGGAIMAGAGLAVDAFAAGVTFLSGAFEAMGVSAGIAWTVATGGMILVVAGVVAGVALIVTHWKWFKGVVVDVWHGIESVAKDVFDWITNKLEWIIAKILWIPKHLASIGQFFGLGDNSSQSAINKLTPSQLKKTNTQLGALGLSPVHQRRVGGYGGATPTASGGLLGAVKGTASHDSDSNRQQSHPAAKGGDINLHHVTKLGSRIAAEEVVHFANKKNALSGAFAG